MTAKTPEEKAAAAAAKEAAKAAAAADPAAAEAEKTAKVSKTSVSVEHPGGVREFSKDVHGDKFADLAAEFAASNNGKVLA